ncbi:MAG: glycosyltransferase family 2 protein [Terriglobales bacterium]
MNGRYVLITPARNEEAFIERTIQCVAAQTLLPLKWVIVNDGSTDSTGEIVKRYLPKYPWLELVELPINRDRSFAKKVYAFNAGYERLKSLEFEVLANLDADLSVDNEYCAFLMAKFEGDPTLGVAGTIFKEEGGYSSGTDSFEGQNHVAGGCQMFRRKCFEQIGGYVPNKAGGVDWIAVTTARMMGWKTRSFREKFFFHYRSLGTAGRSSLESTFSYGEKDYYLGNHPMWEFCRVLYRSTKKPYLIDGVALLLGYVSAALRRMQRPISRELMNFHRQEELDKLKAIVKSVSRLKKLDSFEVTPISE